MSSKILLGIIAFSWILTAQTTGMQPIAQAAQSQIQSDSADSAGTNVPKPSTNESITISSSDSMALPQQATLTVTDSFSTLTIHTTPDSALVIYDEALKGKSPIVLSKLTPGKHTIVLQKRGYLMKKVVVNITPGSENKVSFDLVKPASLTVSSQPAGAIITLNNTKMGNTPFFSDQIKPDTYTISIGLQGYEKYSIQKQIAPGSADTIVATLTPLQQQQQQVEKTAESSPKAEKKQNSVLDKIALGIFVAFSLGILLIELTHKN